LGNNAIHETEVLAQVADTTWQRISVSMDHLIFEQA
jgi:hypothetical protein